MEKEYIHFKKSKEAYFKFDFIEPVKQNIEIEVKKYALKRYDRIPLYVNDERFNSFKEDFLKFFEFCLDKHSVKKLFDNTFDYPTNSQKLQFLHLEATKQAALNEAFMKTCKLYKEKILPRYSNEKHLGRDKSIEEINREIVEKVTKRTEERDSFPWITAKNILKHRLAIPKKVDRIHFMIAMYNSFPEIRKSYKNSKHKNLNEFFRQRIKNIKKA